MTTLRLCCRRLTEYSGQHFVLPANIDMDFIHAEVYMHSISSMGERQTHVVWEITNFLTYNL